MKLFSISILLLATQLLMAQSKTDTTQLQEVVIVENRFQSNLKKIPQNIARIDMQQINALPLRSVAEALSYVPGLDVRQRGVFGSQADIGIRGGSFEQSLVLINGMKITDPQTGHHTMNLPLPLFSVQAIDVLKGPAARIYGQNAFAGAINVITQLPTDKVVKAQVFGGDYDLKGANVLFALPYKKLRQAFSASALQNGNYHYNSDAQQASVLYEAQVQLSAKDQIRAMLAASTRSMGASGYYSDKYPDQWESTSTMFAGVTYSHTTEKTNFQVRNYYRLNNDEFRLKRFMPSFYTNTHQSRVLAVEGNGSFKSKAGQLGYGIDLRREEITSSNLGNHQRNLLGIYLEHKVQIAHLNVRAGVYSNYYQQYGLRYFPGAEIGYNVNQQHFVYGNWGYSFRVPTYTELYYKDPTTSSNPNLLPEKARSIELGYRYTLKKLQVQLNVFERKTLNLIDYVKAIDESGVAAGVWSPNNINKVNFVGAECAANYKFVVRDSVFSLLAVNLSYNYIEANLIQNQNYLSRYALNQLKQQLIFGLQFIALKKLTCNATLRMIERKDLNKYILLDAKANYQLSKRFSAFVECNNLGNIRYIETGYVQMPGRWARAGINYNL